MLLHCVYERFTAGDGNHMHLVVLVGFDFDSTIMCRKWSGSRGKMSSNTGVNPTNLPGQPPERQLPYDIRSNRTRQDQAGPAGGAPRKGPNKNFAKISSFSGGGARTNDRTSNSASEPSLIPVHPSSVTDAIGTHVRSYVLRTTYCTLGR